MNTLTRNSLFTCLLLLSACAMQEQNPVAKQANTPTPVITEQPAANIFVDAKPFVETRPNAASKEKKMHCYNIRKSWLHYRKAH